MPKTIKNPDTGRQIKLTTALTYDKNSKVYKMAKQMLGHKKKDTAKSSYIKGGKKVSNYGPSNTTLRKLKQIVKGFKGKKISEICSKLPSKMIPDKDIIWNKNIKKGWIAKWRNPETGRPEISYTMEAMAKNQVVKRKKISNMKHQKQMIKKCDKKMKNMLRSKDDREAQVGAVTMIIRETLCRPGGTPSNANKGVLDLPPSSLTYDSNKKQFRLYFKGKSYQQNSSTIKDPELVKYLLKRKKVSGRKLFDYNYQQYYKTYRENITDEVMPKDWRTYGGNEYAEKVGMKESVPKIKKVVQNKKLTDEQKMKIISKIFVELDSKVAKRLNNLKTTTKESYTLPEIIDGLMKKSGVKIKLRKEILLKRNKYDRALSKENFFPKMSLIEIFNLNEQNNDNDGLDPEVLENCEVYPTPDFILHPKDYTLIPIDEKNIEEKQ